MGFTFAQQQTAAPLWQHMANPTGGMTGAPDAGMAGGGATPPEPPPVQSPPPQNPMDSMPAATPGARMSMGGKNYVAGPNGWVEGGPGGGTGGFGGGQVPGATQENPWGTWAQQTMGGLGAPTYTNGNQNSLAPSVSYEDAKKMADQFGGRVVEADYGGGPGPGGQRSFAIDFGFGDPQDAGLLWKNYQNDPTWFARGLMDSLGGMRNEAQSSQSPSSQMGSGFRQWMDPLTGGNLGAFATPQNAAWNNMPSFYGNLSTGAGGGGAPKYGTLGNTYGPEPGSMVPQLPAGMTHGGQMNPNSGIPGFNGQASWGQPGFGQGGQPPAGGGGNAGGGGQNFGLGGTLFGGPSGGSGPFFGGGQQGGGQLGGGMNNNPFFMSSSLNPMYYGNMRGYAGGMGQRGPGGAINYNPFGAYGFGGFGGSSPYGGGSLFGSMGGMGGGMNGGLLSMLGGGGLGALMGGGNMSGLSGLLNMLGRGNYGSPYGQLY